MKLAPALIEQAKFWDPEMYSRELRELRALLSVAKVAIRWRDSDGTVTTGEWMVRLSDALEKLERISKGDKSCPAK
jgi:hypothetical protein